MSVEDVLGLVTEQRDIEVGYVNPFHRPGINVVPNEG
jgi:hypothetical protein